MLRSITQLCWPLACLGLLVLLLQMSAYECREWSPKTDEEKSLTDEWPTLLRLASMDNNNNNNAAHRQHNVLKKVTASNDVDEETEEESGRNWNRMLGRLGRGLWRLRVEGLADEDDVDINNDDNAATTQGDESTEADQRMPIIRQTRAVKVKPVPAHLQAGRYKDRLNDMYWRRVRTYPRMG